MKHDTRLASDLVIQSLILKIERLTARVDALEQCSKDRATLAKASERFAIKPSQEAKDRTTMAAICAAVSAAHGVSIDQMKAKFGPRSVVGARAEFCRLARIEGFSLPRIGRFLGGRDHTTILHLQRRAEGNEK